MITKYLHRVLYMKTCLMLLKLICCHIRHIKHFPCSLLVEELLKGIEGFLLEFSLFSPYKNFIPHCVLNYIVKKDLFLIRLSGEGNLSNRSFFFYKPYLYIVLNLYYNCEEKKINIIK